MFLASIWGLLGNEDKLGDQLHFANFTIHCQGTPPFNLEIAYTRNDSLNNVTADIRTWPHFFLPWVDYYRLDPTPTLLVTNMGMHSKTYAHYQRDFDAFVETVEGLNRSLDLVVYRTSVPGHAHCEDQKAPFATSEEFHVANVYNWAEVVLYNKYSRHQLSNLVTAKSGEVNGVSWMLLDVYPITILRPDGHLVENNGDCLHYKVPGVPDW